MKKIIYLLLILVLASFTTSKELITLSGKIINTENGKISIKGESFEKEITLNADGSFSENISISYDGIYTLETNRNQGAIGWPATRAPVNPHPRAWQGGTGATSWRTQQRGDKETTAPAVTGFFAGCRFFFCITIES